MWIGRDSRVDVEPGVVVAVNPERTVGVWGTLVGRGLPEAPITLIGSQSGTPAFLGTGVLELSDAIVEGRINAATVIVTNSRFQGNGVLGDFVLSDGGSSIREDFHEAGQDSIPDARVLVIPRARRFQHPPSAADRVFS